MKKIYALVPCLALILALNAQGPGSPRTNTTAFNPDWAPFYHGVASGDPDSESVIIWTRVTPDTMGSVTSVELDWRIATDPELNDVIQTGTVNTGLEQDFTAKVLVEGLEAGTTYYYNFTYDNSNSLTGRTKTVPEGSTAEQLKFAVVSCSNYQAGYFNAYKRISERNDLDAVIHLGDYIYEYEQGGYGLEDFFEERALDPETEILSLEDYRTRYSLYRLDTMLIRVHQQHPFITVWDDHESANDAWRGGAENHNEIISLDSLFDNDDNFIGFDTTFADEGEWDERLEISKQVYFEWMPVRDNPERSVYRKISYGDLADLILLDTRVEGRDEQILNIYDPELNSPDRTILGEEQKAWLKDQLENSTAQWKLIGQQVTFSEFNIGWAGPPNGAPFEAAEALFLDFWDGYPAERLEMLSFISSREIDDVVILTGDVHASFVYDVPLNPNDVEFTFNDTTGLIETFVYSSNEDYDPATGEGSVAVEFVTPSVTSANFDENLGVEASVGLGLLINTSLGGFGNPNPHMKSKELNQHGYYVIDITPERAQADYFLSPIRQIAQSETFNEGWLTNTGESFVNRANAGAPPKEVQDPPAPLQPKVTTSTRDLEKTSVILGVYPNPFSDESTLHYSLTEATSVRVDLLDVNGQLIRTLEEADQMPGVHRVTSRLGDLPEGTYIYKLITDRGEQKAIIVMKK